MRQRRPDSVAFLDEATRLRILIVALHSPAPLQAGTPMANKNADLVRLLTLLPWWVNLALAPLAYLLASRAGPAMLADNTFAPILSPVFAVLGFAFAAFFVIAALVSFVSSIRKRRLLDRQTDLHSIRAPSLAAIRGTRCRGVPAGRLPRRRKRSAGPGRRRRHPTSQGRRTPSRPVQELAQSPRRRSGGARGLRRPDRGKRAAGLCRVLRRLHPGRAAVRGGQADQTSRRRRSSRHGAGSPPP